MNYTDAINYIHSVCWKGSVPGLTRIGELCKLLGNPEKRMKFIHIAGTNGKGSVSKMCECILRSAGYRVGLFTSPYVSDFCERICVDGENIPHEKLAEITARVKPFAESMEDLPTEFELITAIAFEYFASEKCDIVVLEAGMGGRLDSTNIIEAPEISVITGISFDHMAYLGGTLPEIAAEKAGIIKSGCPVAVGDIDSGAKKVILEKAKEKASRVYEFDKTALEVKSAKLDGADFDYKERKNLRVNLAGIYQPKNAALALEVADALIAKSYKISDADIRAGLSAARWSARFEKLCDSPLVIFDGGHNIEGVRSAVDSYKTYFGNTKAVLLSGVMRDKEYGEMVSMMCEIAECAVCVTPDNTRALEAVEYAKVFALGKHRVRACAFGSISEGVRFAMGIAKEKKMPLLCLGSLYMYKDVAPAVCANADK